MDSIPTCEDQEDHVAMSTTAARRAARVIENTRRVIAIEMQGAVRAAWFEPKSLRVFGWAKAQQRVSCGPLRHRWSGCKPHPIRRD